MTHPASSPTAAVLIIGNEILSGRTADANLNYIAQKLNEIGIRLVEARVIPDIEDRIVEAVNSLRTEVDYLLTTGGIGPTHDDITADSLGKAFGVPVVVHEEGRRRLAAYYTKPGELTEARLRMARVPEGAELIDNPVSIAPGFRIGNVYVMAGVPNIMRGMMDGIAANLRHGPQIHAITITGYVAESTIAEPLGVIAARYPQLDIGSYPWVRNTRWGTSLVTRGTERQAVEDAAREIFEMMMKIDPDSVRD